MKRFLLILDTIDIFSMHRFDELQEKILFNIIVRKKFYLILLYEKILFKFKYCLNILTLNHIFHWRNLIELITKYHSYPKSLKIDAFQQKNMHLPIL